MLHPSDTSMAAPAVAPRRYHLPTLAVRTVLVTGICLLAALVATWPLGLVMVQAIPLGTEHEATVPLFSLWSLWWTADRVGHGFVNYWNAPFFYPNHGVFTYSEPMPLIGLLVAPLWGLGAAPALIYNLALLALLTLNGVFGYRLARALDLPALPALLAGILTVTLPFVAKVYGVLPVVALFGMLWALEGLVRFGKSGVGGWALWAAGGGIVTYLTCQQYTLLFVPFAGAAGIVALAQQRFRLRSVAWLIGAGVGAGLVVLLIALPALQVHAQLGFQRSEEVVQALSAHPSDWLTRPDTAVAPLPPPDPADTAGLFPGILLTALALAGVIAGARDRAQRRWTLYLAGSAVVALFLSLGLNLDLAGWRPFATLRTVMPGLQEFRTPYRFAAIAQLCLPLLAARTLISARQIWPRHGLAVLLILGLLGAGENLAAPGILVGVPASSQQAWTTWLRDQPADTVIAHVPFPNGGHVAAYEVETWRLFAQIDHHKPMVNGYSSYFPQVRTPEGVVVPSYTQFQIAMAQQFPNEKLLCVLNKSLKVNTLVVDSEWLAAHRPEVDAYRSFLQPAYADEQVHIYHLQAPPGQCQL